MSKNKILRTAFQVFAWIVFIAAIVFGTFSFLGMAMGIIAPYFGNQIPGWTHMNGDPVEAALIAAGMAGGATAVVMWAWIKLILRVARWLQASLNSRREAGERTKRALFPSGKQDHTPQPHETTKEA